LLGFDSGFAQIFHSLISIEGQFSSMTHLLLLAFSRRLSYRAVLGNARPYSNQDRSSLSIPLLVSDSRAPSYILHQSSFLLYSTKSQPASSSYNLRAGLSCFVDHASRKQPNSLAASAAAMIISRPWPLPRSDGSMYRSAWASGLCL
jgi:hypothetical protein